MGHRQRTEDLERTCQVFQKANKEETDWMDQWCRVINWEDFRSSSSKQNHETTKIIFRYKRVPWDRNRVIEIHRMWKGSWRLFAMAVSDYDNGPYKFEQIVPQR